MIVIIGDAADQKKKPYESAFKKKITLYYLPIPDMTFYSGEYWCIEINSLSDLLAIPHDCNIGIVRADDASNPYRHQDMKGNFLPSLMVDMVASCGDCE